MSEPNVLALVVLVLVAIGWYLSYSAARLDRLHARVQGTLAALDAQLVRRAEATLELANSGVLDAASALMLASAASDSLSAAEDEDTDADQQRFSHDREGVESRLSEALGLALSAGRNRDDMGNKADAVFAELARQRVPDRRRLARGGPRPSG